MLAMKLAQNDLEARNQFNGLPASRFNYLIKYICRKFNKKTLENLVETMENNNSAYERNGCLFKHCDMKIVPNWFTE